MDAERTRLLRELLDGSGWVDRTREFAASLRRTTPGGLLLVGTPTDEPWHLAAHLDDESQLAGRPEIAPVLIRWSVPPEAPPHLSVTLARLEAARRNETVFVVAPDAPPESLLQRVSDARRIGATILSIYDGNGDLDDLVHDRIVVPAIDETLFVTQSLSPDVDIDTVQHLVSVAAGESATRANMRSRLASFLERVSGPPSTR